MNDPYVQIQLLYTDGMCKGGQLSIRASNTTKGVFYFIMEFDSNMMEVCKALLMIFTEKTMIGQKQTSCRNHNFLGLDEHKFASLGV